jgi:hypothetical protein
MSLLQGIRMPHGFRPAHPCIFSVFAPEPPKFGIG